MSPIVPSTLQVAFPRDARRRGERNHAAKAPTTDPQLALTIFRSVRVGRTDMVYINPRAAHGSRMSKPLISTQQSPRKPKAIDAHVGKRLRTLRMLAGLSHAELGKAVGISFQQLQKYEKGTNRVPAGHMYQFAAALECSPMDFYEGLDEHRNGASAYPSDMAIRLSKALTEIDEKARRAVLVFVRSLSEPTPHNGAVSKRAVRGTSN